MEVLQMTQIKDFAMMIAMDLEKVSPSTQITVTIITFIAVILMLQKTVEIYLIKLLLLMKEDKE
jgi:nicotinamide riboside transporter PnuC